MALPIQLKGSMLPAELEFIASEELIEIMPTVKMDKIQFITVSSSNIIHASFFPTKLSQ